MIRIGTRKSKLALIQTNLVIQKIKEALPDLECEIVPIVTSGDLITNQNLYDIGGKALFLKEIELALLDSAVDIAVHSLKDVPGRLPEGLEIKAVLEREDPRDVLISTKASSIIDLPKGCKLGSSSVRRKIFVNKIRPDIEVVMFRGNVDSRLKKLLDGEVDATILAAAGLNRMEAFNADYCHMISLDEMLPAVGQGVVAVEIKTGNKLAEEVCLAINHQETFELIRPERAYIEYIDATCKTPLAAYTELLDQNSIRTRFLMSNFTGDYIFTHEETGLVTDGIELGIRAAKHMINKL
jgi:hydroxymethylbilane synthase